MTQYSNGLVVASRQEAAQAGAEILKRGGNATDAAVATAFALAVTDPANCGLSGFGGMVIRHPLSATISQVDFNTAPVAAFDLDKARSVNRSGPFLCGGMGVSVPTMIPGLATAHRQFGRLPFGQLIEPAVALAEEGFIVNADLASHITWALANMPVLSPMFHQVFCPGGKVLQAGDRLRQPALAKTLRQIALNGAMAMWQGAIVAAITRCVAEFGGLLTEEDVRSAQPSVEAAIPTKFAGATVYGHAKAISGYGILSEALDELNISRLGANRSADYVTEIVRALTEGWSTRLRKATNIALAQHTTHLCSADAEGGLASLTFTNGPLWFGSGLVVPETGIVLNAGANLTSRLSDGSVIALNNISPVLIAGRANDWHAVGTPGGYHIPATVMLAIVDLLCYDMPLAAALAQPRFSVRPGIGLEMERDRRSQLPDVNPTQLVQNEEYYGPATGISMQPSGNVTPAVDPRFITGCAMA